ncbi:MAG: MalY/PatB family protein [Coprococcus sp.]
MKYNFTTVGDRYNTGSKKWAEVTEYLPDCQDDIIPFSVADMEFETAPEIREGLKKYIDRYVMGYANPTAEFKAAVCEWMEKRHGWKVEPEWILSNHGIVDAFYDCVKAYTKPGEGVMLMTPIYYPMYSAISSNNRVLVDNPLINNNGRYEIDWADFEAKCKDDNTKILILCSPHNPSGRVWTLEELTRIGRICIDNNVLICSDEIHFDILMPGYKHIVFANISEEFAQHSVIMTAPSKTFNLAGLQTSSVIIPNEGLREIFHKHQLTTCPNPKCNVLGYEANRIAYTECEGWLEECLAVINKNRQVVEDFMAKEFPEVIITPLEGTYLLWMDFRALGIDYMELARLLRVEAKVFFDDGYIFGDEYKGFERWNLAGPTRYIEEALERMKTALNNHRK